MSAPLKKSFVIGNSEQLTLAKLQAHARDAWNMMYVSGTEANALALQHGIELEKLGSKLSDSIVLKPDGAGIVDVDGVSIWYAGKAAYDVWRYVVVPIVRAKIAGFLLKEKKKEAQVENASKGSSRKKAAKRKAPKKKPSPRSSAPRAKKRKKRG